MTNYNEKLDAILNDMQVEEYGLVSKSDTKQAITSLIKELVAEAKPERLKESDYTLNMRVPNNPPSNTTRTNLYRKGYNEAINQFEQNLLKALEEVK